MPDVVVVIVAVLLAATAGGGLALLRMPPERREGSVDGVDTVEVRLAAGRVEISESDRVDVGVELSARRRVGRPRPAVTRAGSVLRVDARAGEASVRLRLPRRTRVRAEVRSGEITLWGSRGDLSLVTETGAIVARELAAGKVGARSRGGDVVLHFSERPAGVAASSETGAVTVVLPDGAYEMEVEAADPGAATVQVPHTDDAGCHVLARSVSGPVRVSRASPRGPVRI